ncbi:MAG: redox-sensing transcriptional repressor Rex [Bacilli bacterium]|jgi:redox-sensing transcriptional repressor|nr:redox-sensing transcriptional repressor Rex [Bacilli bacterium]
MRVFSKNQLQRYPIYLKFFKELQAEGTENISSPKIARALGYSEEQIRKDLQAVSDSAGRPKKGRSVDKLIDNIESFLGYRGKTEAFLLGTGHLGAALLNYPGFQEMGLSITEGFDADIGKIGKTVGSKSVLDIRDLPTEMAKRHCRIVVLTVPASVAQKVADFAIGCGALGIWNFTPAHINVPDGVVIENVNLASSLAVLNHRLNEKMAKRH